MEKSSGNKKGQLLYIIEATVEYFISLMITGAYLAKITTTIGMSAGLTGILTAFVSLGYVFQIFALFLAGKRKVKRLITLLHTVNQACFAFIYLIPLVPVPKVFKHVFFVIFLLVGYIISNLIGAPKIDWYMSFVGEKERGSFTAKKEIVSLISGILFSYLVSFVIDHFETAGKLSTAFAISAVALFALATWHTLTLLRTPEKANVDGEKEERISFLRALKSVFGSARVRKVLVISIVRDIIISAVVAFYGVYTTSSPDRFGLGFSMSFIAVLTMLYSLSRSLVSRPMGKFADKYSFKSLCVLGYSLLAVGFAVNIFTTPANGKVLYTVYYLLSAVSMAATNSCVINLLYEEVQPKDRMCAYAVQQSVSGLVGFAFALIAGIFVDSVVARPNGQLCGMYAQQWLSLVGVLLSLGIVAFVMFAMKNRKGNVEENTNE